MARPVITVIITVMNTVVNTVVDTVVNIVRGIFRKDSSGVVLGGWREWRGGHLHELLQHLLR
jgi:hypothetical protein